MRHSFLKGFNFTTILAGAVPLLFFSTFYTIAFAAKAERPDPISTFPRALVDLTNENRVKLGLPALKENAALEVAAQLKVNDMVLKGYFSHNTPEGVTPWHWLTDAGYSYLYAGENIAVNFKDPKSINDSWMRSPKHKANIIDPKYTEIGVAVAEGRYKLRRAIFVVQMFGTPKSEEVSEVRIIKPAPVVIKKKSSATAAAAAALTPKTGLSTPTKRR